MQFPDLHKFGKTEDLISIGVDKEIFIANLQLFQANKYNINKIF